MSDESTDWRFENPTADFDRSDWVEVGQTLLLLLGVAGIGAALGIRVTMAAVYPPDCAGVFVAVDPYCKEFVTTVNRHVRWTLGSGAVLLVAAAAVERGLQH